jgi:hypothetical protein
VRDLIAAMHMPRDVRQVPTLVWEVEYNHRAGHGNVTHLDALCSIHKQKGALAGSQAAGDLVAEVHVPGSVYQIDQVVLTPVVVDQRHCLRLKRHSLSSQKPC